MFPDVGGEAGCFPVAISVIASLEDCIKRLPVI